MKNPEISSSNKWTINAIIQKIFPILGVIMIASGIGYFLYTGIWDQVGKSGRLALGFITGISSILIGYNFQEKLRNFSNSIIGGGIILLYITLIYGGRFDTASEINQIIPEGFALLISLIFSGLISFYSQERKSKEILMESLQNSDLAKNLFFFQKSKIFISKAILQTFLNYI